VAFPRSLKRASSHITATLNLQTNVATPQRYHRRHSDFISTDFHILSIRFRYRSMGQLY